MSKAPPYWNKAKRFLVKRDKIIKNLITKYKNNNLTTRKNVFFSLCKSIIGQQISVEAANSVFVKFQDACRHKHKHIKTVRPGTTVYVCDNCELQLGWPSPDELDAWMRK